MTQFRTPRIDPWGTPALIVRHLECALSITTRCFLSARYFFIHNNKDPCIPIFSNLLSKPLCQTLSKALLISQKLRVFLFLRLKLFRFCF